MPLFHWPVHGSASVYPKQQLYASGTKPDLCYTVTDYGPQGPLACNCPGFVFRQSCRHVRQYLKAKQRP